MKEKSVYKRNYKEKELFKYEELVNNIKNNSHENNLPLDNNIYKRNYFDYDGDFFTITSMEISRSFSNSHHIAQINIEKIGPDLAKISAIEKLLEKYGFKKEEI